VDGVGVTVVQDDTRGKVLLDVEYGQQALTGRLNLSHTLDVRITTYPDWWGLQWSFYLDIQNLYNHENQQAVRSYIDEAGNLKERYVNGIPIFPSLGMSVVF